jgi:hypothetical protein
MCYHNAIFNRETNELNGKSQKTPLWRHGTASETTPRGNVANVQMLPIANTQCPIGIGNIGNWQRFHIYTIIS